MSPLKLFGKTVLAIFNLSDTPITGDSYTVVFEAQQAIRVYDSTTYAGVTDNGSTIQYTVNPAGESLSVGSASNAGQTPAGEPPSTSTTLNLNGLTSSNLASSLLSQLGGASGNYTVSYGSGALSIGISSTGTTAGVAWIGSSANSIQETILDNIFTSDGTANGSQTLNVSVGISAPPASGPLLLVLVRTCPQPT